MRFFGRIRVFVCSFEGHDYAFGHEHCQLWLVCTKCGFRTPGWDWSSGSSGKRLEYYRPLLTKLGPKYLSLSKPEAGSLKETVH